MVKATGFLAYVRAARELLCTSVSRKCLILYYATNCDEHGKFFKSTLDISIETGVSEKFIRECNKDWQKYGLITVTEHPWHSGKANDYQIHLGKLQSLVKDRVEKKNKAKLIAKKKAVERTLRWRANKAQKTTGLLTVLGPSTRATH